MLTPRKAIPGRLPPPKLQPSAAPPTPGPVVSSIAASALTPKPAIRGVVRGGVRGVQSANKQQTPVPSGMAKQTIARLAPSGSTPTTSRLRAPFQPAKKTTFSSGQQHCKDESRSGVESPVKAKRCPAQAPLLSGQPVKAAAVAVTDSEITAEAVEDTADPEVAVEVTADTQMAVAVTVDLVDVAVVVEAARSVTGASVRTNSVVADIVAAVSGSGVVEDDTVDANSHQQEDPVTYSGTVMVEEPVALPNRDDLRDQTVNDLVKKLQVSELNFQNSQEELAHVKEEYAALSIVAEERLTTIKSLKLTIQQKSTLYMKQLRNEREQGRNRLQELRDLQEQNRKEKAQLNKDLTFAKADAHDWEAVSADRSVKNGTLTVALNEAELLAEQDKCAKVELQKRCEEAERAAKLAAQQHGQLEREFRILQAAKRK